MKYFLLGSIFIILFAFSLQADAAFSPLPDGAVVTYSESANKSWNTNNYDGETAGENLAANPGTLSALDSCVSSYPDMDCSIEQYSDDAYQTGTWAGGLEMRQKGHVRVVAFPSGFSCESPNYIDVVSGECVSPEEICYTNLENMADECVLIGSPEAENCVTDESGLELCLGDNPLCYQANGKTVCPDSDSVCGEKNGTFQCVSPQEEGCGLFNGERVCFTPDGDKVDSDSPDHPDNGGNLDGDQNNDVTDSRPPEEGGDPDNQPNQPLPTTDANRASEKTAKDSLNELRKINDGLKKNTEAVKDTADQFREEVSQSELDSIQQNGASGSWDDPATGTWADVDGYSDDISDTSDDYGVGMLDGIGDTTSGLVSQGSCRNLGWNFQGHSFQLPCEKTQKIRDLLSWVFYILTVWALFDIVTTPVTRPN
jgi:hypothetical protein